VAVDFLAYLEERESNEATEELLRVPGLVEGLNEAGKQVSKRNSVNWRKVRQDV
jgi:hypothetical protein